MRLELDVLLQSQLKRFAFFEQVRDLSSTFLRIKLALVVEQFIKLVLPFLACFMLTLQLLSQLLAFLVVLQVSTGSVFSG